MSRPNLQRGQILIGIYCRKKNNDPFFSGPAASRCSKACLHKVSRKKLKNWLRRTNIKSNLTLEIKYRRKPRNYNTKPLFLHLTARKSKSPRRVWELDHEILHTCLMCSCRAFYDVFFFNPAENVWSLKTRISQKNTKTQISDEKKQKTNYSLKTWQGHTKHVCKFSGSNSQKRRGHLHVKGILGFMLEPACIFIVIAASVHVFRTTMYTISRVPPLP